MEMEDSGDMKLYGLNGSWQIISRMDTKLPGGTFSIAGTDGSLVLAGSIVRYEDFAYCAENVMSRPKRTGVDWQQADYPAPATAADALQRYFEARAYDIAAEQAVLTAQPAEGSLFTAEQLSALAAPDVPGTVNAQAYLTQETRTLFEVDYISTSTRLIFLPSIPCTLASMHSW